MKLLVFYGTIEGQTGKIAGHIEERLRDAGYEVVLIDADDVTDIPFDGIDGAILAASVHQRRHPKNFEASLIAQQEGFAQCRTLLISVSLSAAFPEGLEEADEYVVEMKMRTKLEPDAELLVAGAVRVAQYDYFAMQVLRHVVLRDRDVDPGAGSYEFTDWEALDAGVADFVAGLE